MKNAFFIVPDGLGAGNLRTVHGPFADEAAAIAAAATFIPGAYTIYGGATAGKTFAIAAPVVQFTSGI